MMLEKFEVCPNCDESIAFSYDGQICMTCSWGIIPDVPMRTHMAMNDVITERCRQIHAEGFTFERDNIYRQGELAQAAATYALHSTGRYGTRALTWPWSADWWKPSTPRRDLVKGAALILAEIERLDRAEAAKAGQA